MTALTVEMAQRGQLTIPKAMRDKYGIGDGQKMTILDIGGVFIVSPRPMSVDTPADLLREGLIASGATLEGMLTDLRRKREADGTH